MKVTWLGHSTFLLGTPEGKTILVDPWLATNPKCPAAFHEVASDAILITHGHGDHAGDAISAAQRCSGPIVAIYDLTTWLQGQGAPAEKLLGMNKGGTVHLPGLDVSVTMTTAHHSSSTAGPDGANIYLGDPAGFVVRDSNGTTLYIAGDTCLFGDMALIHELERPSAAILPIGDHFTMGPKAAAFACKLLQVAKVVPCHHGTFPVLTGTPSQLEAALRELKLATEVIALTPGSSTTL